ncbi:hypothetical protein QN239_07325 [Mycolicibacterium sp. Y3]
MAAALSAFVVGAPVTARAATDPAPELVQAVLAERDGAACGPLNHNPTVEHAADIVNRSTFTYLDHSAQNVPADGPHPTAILKDLGIDTGKAISLQGAAHDEADAIKVLLLEGRDVIPDCSYTDFGVSHQYEPGSGYHLVVAVLVGTS